MTVGEARAEGAAVLRASGADTPELDAALLLAEVLGCGRSDLILRAYDELAPTHFDAFRTFLARRAEGECVAYILGSKEFRGLEFIVTPEVLVPRPDTEILVEAALEWLAARKELSLRTPRVMDVCTGSGCIAVSLKTEFPDAVVQACDLSRPALDVASRNAERHGADVAFTQSDLLGSVTGSFDLIVSNPPYVPSSVIPGLSAEVRREPLLALDGGEDGLVLIRRLILESASRLDQGGRLLIESGPEQTGEISRLLGEAGFSDLRCYPDLAGRPRTTGGTWKPDRL